MSERKIDLLFFAALILIILIPHIFVIFAQREVVLNWFTTDDAFYYFKTAQNIVEGQGVTFDGIARTNGFHPLWMILLLPIFTLGGYDLILPLRFVIVLQGLLGLGSAIILFQFVRTICSRWTAFVSALIWALTPSIYTVVFKGGTEAGLNAFFLVFLWWQYFEITEKISHDKASFRQIFRLGIIASLTLLSRLDNVYLVFVAGGWLLLRFWHSPGEKSISVMSTIRFTIKRWLKIGIPYFVPVVGTLGFYLIINQIFFSSAMPVSGKIKRWWGTLKFTVYGKPPQDIGDLFAEFFSSNDSEGPWAIVMLPIDNLWNWFNALSISIKYVWGPVILVVLGSIIFLMIRNRRFIGKTFWRWNLIPLFIACLVQILYYKTTGHIAQKEWYWIVENLFIILVLGIMFEVLYREVKRFPNGDVLVGAVAIITTLSLITPYLKIPLQVLTFTPSDDEHFYIKRANWLEENTEPNSLIGMTGSGSSGYFVQDRVVVNLDGLISSQEYFVHLQNSTADEYLESIGLEYVFGNAYILQRSNPYQWNFENRLEEFRYFELGDKTLVLFKFH